MRQTLSFTKNHLWLWVLVLLGTQLFSAMLNPVKAQPQVAPPTYYNSNAAGTGNSFPLNSGTNKVQWIYGPGVFATGGTGSGTPVPAGQAISQVFFKLSTTTSGTKVYPDFTIKLGQNVGTANTIPSTTFNTGLTTVFYSAAYSLTGVASGNWFGVTLPTPFPYDPSLSLMIEISTTNTTTGGNTVAQVTTTGLNQRLWGTFTGATGTSGTGLLNFGVEVIPSGPCTDPPTPGIAVASPSTPICNGQNVTLNITGSSTGSGQLYQWESSSTSGGPYTSVGAQSANPSLIVNPSTTTYYRCQVTCGTSTLPTTEVTVSVNPPFPGGNYTINSNLPTGGTNFNSFTAAVAAISCGIAGPIVFDVDPGSGPYVEQISLPATIGATAINTVTFNGNGRTIQFSATTGARHIIQLNGADYITFNDLVVNCPGSFGWGFHFINGADYNTINFCTVNASTTNATTTDFGGVVMSNSTTSMITAGNNGNYNIIQDNTFIGGGYNISLCGAGVGTENIGNVVSNNQCRDAYGYAIYMLNQKNAQINANDLSRPTRAVSTTTGGVFMTTGCTGNLVENNRIHNFFNALPTSTSTFYGVYCSADAVAGDPNRVINNVVYEIEGNGTQYGFYNTSGDNINIYHNTFALDHLASTAGATYGIFQTTAATGINIRNNVVTIRRGGTGLKVGLNYATSGTPATSNNNAVFLNSAGSGTQNYGNNGGTNYATLVAWQATGFDLNSVQADPVYTNPGTGDFKPTAVAVNNLGINVGVGFDINGSPRSNTNPDPGAYEYDLVGLDAGISWVSPTSPTTPGLKTITVSITNNLSTVIDSVTLSYTDFTITETESFTGLNLLPSTSTNLSFTVPYNLTMNTALEAYINSVNGVLDFSQVNDTTNIINLCMSLSGNYTLNSALPTGSGNFQSFSALASYLNCGGITGPVVVDVVAGSGPYTEQVSFGNIPGSSLANTVTINGNGNTLTFASGTEYHTLRLNGADYMTFNNLNVVTTGASTGFALLISNAANFNNFNNCTFTTPLNITATTSSAVAISGSTTSAITSGTNGNNNTFSNCTMTGGYYCVSVYGNTSANISGNAFLNCTMREFYLYGLYNAYATTTIVRDCIFERPNRAGVTTTYGVFLTTSSLGCLIERNRFRNLFTSAPTSTSLCYAMYCSATGSAGNENQFINNLVHSIGHNGTLAGVYLTGASFVNVFHNTISLDHTAATAGTTYGIYNSGTTGVNIQNNVISITRGGTGSKWCLYYLGIPATTNYNSVFINSAAGLNYAAYDGVTNFATLAAYQAGQPTKDQNSVEVNPSFNFPAGGNFAPTNVLLDNIGNNLGIAVDINGATRSATPDPGAYEFFVAPIDAGMLTLNSPGASGCYTNAENVEVVVRNYGSTTLDFSVNPLTVTALVSGAVNTTLTASPTGTLAPGADLTVVLTPTLDMTSNGTYTISVSTSMTGDGNAANDSLSPVTRIVGPVAGTISSITNQICVSGTAQFILNGSYGGAIQWRESTVSPTGPWTNVGTGTTSYTPASPITVTTYYQAEISCNGNTVYSNTFTVTVNNPDIDSLFPGTRCGTGPVTLSATGTGSTANWYANPTGGLALSTGYTYTPVVTATDTFYVASSDGGANYQLGLPNRVGATTNSGYSDIGLMFDATVPFVLNSVAIYPVATTPSGNVTAVIALRNSAGVTLQSATISVPTSVSPGIKTLIPLNFSVPPGTGHRLVFTSASGGGISGFIRESSTGYTYPYTIPGVASITSAYTGGPSASFYYYFYDWQISSGCEGPRYPVIATVTAAPAVTVSASTTNPCPGSSVNLSVSSSNDPNYTYTWTSTPSGFNASGAGPHTVTPTSTTTYSVYAEDLSAGPNAGCGISGTVVVNAAAALVAGTVSVNQNSYCVSGTPNFTLTGSSGGSIQWQQSTTGATGPWTNVGTGTSNYTPGSPLTQTSWFRVQVNCQATLFDSSNVVQVTINNPSFVNTIPGSRCGTGSVTLQAVPNPGATTRWFANPTGGGPIATGNIFNTPNISSTTTYYAAALVGLGGADSISATLGTTTGINHHMFLLASPTGMTIQDIGITTNMALGALTSWQVYYRPGNYQLVPGANTSSAGWTLISSVTNLPSAGSGVHIYIALNQNLTLAPGDTASFYVAPGAGTTIAYNTTGQGVVNTSNANAVLIGGNRGSSLFSVTTPGGMPNMRFRYSLGCEGSRVPIIATINTAPSVTVSAGSSSICPGGSTSVTVSSSNDPNYTYTWTSTPAGFSASGVGPHTVTPTNTTTYSVYAIDQTAGPNAGCATSGTVTVNTAPALLAGTVSASQSTICISGTPTLTVTGSAGGDIQWQESTTGASGPWTNVGTGATTYTPGSPITQTTWYRVEVSCQATLFATSNVVPVTVNNPQVLSTTPGIVCGTSGSATISAVPSAGASISWFANAVGGSSLGSGNNFTTPSIATTTTYYAEPNIGGGGGSASPLQITEIDLGTNDQLEIQNVSPDPVDFTGWKVAISNSYTDITSVNPNVQVLSGTLAPGAILSWTDLSTAPNYWGSNMFWNPGAFPSFTGWAAILDNNNILRDFVVWNWPAANIAAASINIGGPVITVGSLWSGNGIDATTVAATQSLSRQGTLDNNNAADFAIQNLSIGTTNPGMTLPFAGFGCPGTRVPVVVTVAQPSSSNETYTTCGSYTWNGNTYTSTGTYTYSTLNAAGCDSTVTLNLTITPCNSTLNLTMFIQGYWDGVSGMQPVLFNQGQLNPITDCDTILVELHDAITPSTVAYSTMAVLQTNGTAACVFPSSISGSYYIAVKHRNAIETWSANPVLFSGPVTSYNFSTAATQAFGDNQVEVATGVWGFYSGDVVKDVAESADLLDLAQMEFEISNFSFGYYAEDLTGDGNVDLNDSPILETNILLFISSFHP